MDEAHLLAAARYVALNPVRAGLVKRPEDWPWSSTAALLAGKSDGIVDVRPILGRYGNFADYLEFDKEEPQWRALRKAESTGRPLGDQAWLAALEKRLGRAFARQKPGPKPGRKTEAKTIAPRTKPRARDK